MGGKGITWGRCWRCSVQCSGREGVSFGGSALHPPPFPSSIATLTMAINTPSPGQTQVIESSRLHAGEGVGALGFPPQ